MTMYHTAMWEAVAVAETADDLLRWAIAVAQTALTVDDPQRAVQVYRSPDNRVVIIATGSNGAPDIPMPPAELVLRPPHCWIFKQCYASPL